jgi:hypothetical protein
MPGRVGGEIAGTGIAPAAVAAAAGVRRHETGRSGGSAREADAYVMSAYLARHSERVNRRKEEQRHVGPASGPTAAQRLAALRRRIVARHGAPRGEASEEVLIRDARVGGPEAAGATSSNEDVKMHLAPAAVPRLAHDDQRAETAATAAASSVAWHAVDEPPRVG